MYKISEVAEMLAIEKVKIFEALIVHDEVLSPFVIKERHLSYITEDGVKNLEKLLFGIEPELEENNITVEEEIDIIFEEDHLDQFIKRNEDKKNQLRNEIIDLKRQINTLDKELRMKDDAIIHYQKLFSEDIKWINQLEEKNALTKNEVSYEDEKKSSFFNRLKK
ncbi:MAG: hypothetical protein JEZ08_12130 [Clostridiales bacterium]|nr:hypothetical protein [Clostridiales bacterium]